MKSVKKLEGGKEEGEVGEGRKKWKDQAWLSQIRVLEGVTWNIYWDNCLILTMMASGKFILLIFATRSVDKE